MDITRRQAWLIAARPKTLPAAVSPVLVGSGLAASDEVFRPWAMVAALVAALAIQVAANFANDASDARRGADADRVGPPRMVSQGLIRPGQMWTAAGLAVAVAGLAAVYLISIAGWMVAVIGLVSVAAMLTYVGGPLPYGYRALGEASVFVFFGLVATVGTRFVHDRTTTAAAWVLGAVMGSLAAAILVSNNLRDIDTDAASGKRTLAVVLGRSRTRLLYQGLVAAAFAIIGGAALGGITPPPTAWALVAAPLSIPLFRSVSETDPVKLIGLLAGTARLQLLVGALLGASAAFL